MQGQVRKGLVAGLGLLLLAAPAPAAETGTDPGERAAALVETARERVAAGEYESAAAAFAEALELYPGWNIPEAGDWPRVRARRARADLWQSMKQHEQARAELRAAFAYPARDQLELRAWIHELIGDSYAAEGNWREAERAFQAAAGTGLYGGARERVPSKLENARALVAEQREELRKDAPEDFLMRVRKYVPFPAPGRPDAEPDDRHVDLVLELQRGKTVFILMDVWRAIRARGGTYPEVIDNSIRPALDLARDYGLPIVHLRHEGAIDPAVAPLPGEIVVDNQGYPKFFELIERKGIENFVYVGFDISFCILTRPGGMAVMARQDQGPGAMAPMARRDQEYRLILLRDCTHHCEWAWSGIESRLGYSSTLKEFEAALTGATTAAERKTPDVPPLYSEPGEITESVIPAPRPGAEFALVLINAWADHPHRAWHERVSENNRDHVAPLLAWAREQELLVVHVPNGRKIDPLAAPGPGEAVVATTEELREVLARDQVSTIIYAGNLTNDARMLYPIDTQRFHRDSGGFTGILARDALIHHESVNSIGNQGFMRRFIDRARRTGGARAETVARIRETVSEARTERSRRLQGRKEQADSVRRELLEDEHLLFFVPFDGSADAAQARGSQEGNLSGEGAYSEGVVGKSLHLQGYVEYDFASHMTPAESGTLMFWFRPHWWGDDTVTLNRCVLHVALSGNNYFAIYRTLFKPYTDALYVSMNAAGPPVYTRRWPKYRWVHLAMTWDAPSDEYIVYVNGRQNRKRGWTNTWKSPDDAPRAGRMTLGRFYPNDAPIDACYDELYSFSRALSAEEIAAYVKETVPIH